MAALLPAAQFLLMAKQFPHHLRAKPDGPVTWMRYLCSVPLILQRPREGLGAQKSMCRGLVAWGVQEAASAPPTYPEGQFKPSNPVTAGRLG